jgi:two-component system, OmpR family, sensor kinase
MHLSRWSLRNRLLVSVLIVSAIGIAASDFGAIQSLRNFLVGQLDTQLSTISHATQTQLDRAGIEAQQQNTDDTQFRPINPLRGVPTTTSVTLLDATGTVIGQLGGDLAGGVVGSEFSSFTTAKVLATNGKPFTFRATRDTHYRVIATVLPSQQGSVLVSSSLESVNRTLAELASLFLLISLIVLLLIALLARTFIRISLKPLSEVEVTAAAIADGDLSARLPDANEKTEVGKLATSLNRMLGRIEESFSVRVESESKLRRFVADASHELRTPLTAIRGFAELHRQGAVSGEEKTKELIGRIEKESIRMGSLVEDLLLLARMDQSPELAKDPIDLNELIHEVVASASAAGPDHPITVSLGDAEHFILGDSTRIHQAVANLLANARTHTPTGTPITVTVAESEQEVTVTVADNGPGLSEADQARVFERFFRADTSRARTKGEGSGLGLSIVDAVMKAHGGTVTLQSELGRGAAFTLHFPISA